MITCAFETGHEARLRHVVADAIVLNESQDQILLVKRGPDGLAPGKYALPGGFLDRDEDTRQAVIREVKEETGYEAQVIELFRIVDSPRRQGEDRQNVAFVYIVSAGSKTGESDHEIASTHWFDLEKLPPKEDWAFDHLEQVKLYLKHRANPFALPLIGDSS